MGSRSAFELRFFCAVKGICVVFLNVWMLQVIDVIFGKQCAFVVNAAISYSLFLTMWYVCLLPPPKCTVVLWHRTFLPLFQFYVPAHLNRAALESLAGWTWQWTSTVVGACSVQHFTCCLRKLLHQMNDYLFRKKKKRIIWNKRKTHLQNLVPYAAIALAIPCSASVTSVIIWVKSAFSRMSQKFELLSRSDLLIWKYKWQSCSLHSATHSSWTELYITGVLI